MQRDVNRVIRTHKKVGVNLRLNNIEKVREQIDKTGFCFSQIVNEALEYYFLEHPTTEEQEHDRPIQHKAF